jgi:predicted RNA-binding Zn-ribbon protein involved in translation (DUF1610 family)
MNTIEPDERGLIRACPQCGQRNRLIYERLGSIFRCTKCRTEIAPPTEPVEVPGVPKSTRSSVGLRCPCWSISGRRGVVPVRWSRPSWLKSLPAVLAVGLSPK